MGGARRPHRYDELLRVRCWPRDVASRRVEFGYAIERQEDGELLATARTSLLAVDSDHAITTIPGKVREPLAPVPDPLHLWSDARVVRCAAAPRAGRSSDRSVGRDSGGV